MICGAGMCCVERSQLRAASAVLLHGGFDGMSADAAAVTAIVEEQDIEAGVVQRERAGESVRD